MMRGRMAFTLALLLCFAGAAHAGDAGVRPWPSVEKQMQQDRVRPGTALERLVRANQDFYLLRPDEASDSLGLPLWLRVAWRKSHPDGEYLAGDATGGYPLVLKEIYEWMVTHQNLRRSRIREEDRVPQWDEEFAKAAEAGIVSNVFDAASVGGNVRISGSALNPRSESDIRIDFWNPNRIIGGSNNIVASGRQAMFYSGDGGATWGQTFLPFTGSDQFHSDPTVDWTSDGTAWSTTIGIQSFFGGLILQLRMRSYKSVDGGATWTFDNTFSGTQTQADKQMMWIDHSATSPFKDYIYVCWHNGRPQFVNRRTGPAGAWGTPKQVSGAETTGTAIGCDVKTNANGDVFVFYPDTGSRRIYVVKSTDGGNTYSAPRAVANTFGSFDVGVPSFANRKFVILASGGAYRTASKNNVYLAWPDLSGETGCTADANAPGTNVASLCKSRIFFSRSTDGGATWSAPVKINNPASLNDQFNPWLAVDETSGRLGIIYYDTAADLGRKKTHIYFQSSADDGVTWSAPTQVTTTQTDETIAGADTGNQYGDYNSLSGYANKFFASWTDRRSGGKEEIWTAPIQEP